MTNPFAGPIVQGSLITATHAIAQAKPRRKYDVFFAERRPGCRVPAIDKKLMDLKAKARRVDVSEGPFNNIITGDDAIEVLGKYNPMYSGRPKRLAHQLLAAASGPYKDASLALWHTGLIYFTPILVGVRGMGKRTSAAGLALLDYWAKEFPKFAPFVEAYVSQKAREAITLDCVDIALGLRPASFAAFDEKNKIYQLKADSRELKKMKKEQAERERRVLLAKQSQMLDPYINAQLAGQAGMGWQVQQAIQSQIETEAQKQYRMALSQNGLLNAHQGTRPWAK